MKIFLLHGYYHALGSLFIGAAAILIILIHQFFVWIRKKTKEMKNKEDKGEIVSVTVNHPTMGVIEFLLPQKNIKGRDSKNKKCLIVNPN